MLVALAGVGMSIRFGELRETSWRPLAVGFAVALIVGLGSLVAIIPWVCGASASDGPLGMSCYRAAVAIETLAHVAERVDPGSGADRRDRGSDGSDYGTALRAPEAARRRTRRRRASADQLLLLEHPPVLTLGRTRRPGPHPAPSPEVLAAPRIDVIRVERGGEVTYHGPGQLVAYPIVALAERGLLLRPLVRALEAALVATCASFGVAADAARRSSRLLVRPGRRRPAQDRRARAPDRAGRHVPRDRAQRDASTWPTSSSSIRAGCPASSRPRSPPSGWRDARPRPTVDGIRRARGGDLRAAFADAIGASLAWPEA